MDNPKESMRKIQDVISMYDVLYNNELQEIKQNYILGVDDFSVSNWFDIVATMKRINWIF
mgnify:CR=1 FL=1